MSENERLVCFFVAVGCAVGGFWILLGFGAALVAVAAVLFWSARYVQ